MNMTGLILTIIGLIATVVGIYLTVLFSKSPKRPCRLKYLPTDIFNIFDYHSDEFNKFDIKYGNIPISGAICYISGKLLCDRQDINTAKNQIEIELPDGYEWIDLSLQQSDGMINVENDKNLLKSNVATLRFDELRNNEYITINAIIQGPPIPLEDRFIFQKKMQFSHHIINTDVKVDSFKKPKSFKSFLKKNGLIALFVLSVLFTAFLFQLFSIVIHHNNYWFVLYPLGSLFCTVCIWFFMANQLRNIDYKSSLLYYIHNYLKIFKIN